ncbi:GATA transcription factor 19 [Rutidosis leptorrhynchoides]|uniref:GATA transcription factor 19 n=1 Tax=Rutidosis leptorrhynchoides TaxID=125765 RepID=UPI003A9A501B
MVYPIAYNGESQSPTYTSVVDCTLSLGTPSTRLIVDNHYERMNINERRPNWSSNYCWDILQSSNKPINNFDGAPDSLLLRRCANCDTTSTPLWRNGPRGPKSLCNACGIRFKKEERRATAVATVTAGGGDTAETHHYQPMMNGNMWAPQHKLPSFYSPVNVNEFRIIDDVDDRDSPYISWRLNVTERPGLVNGFTR